LGVVRQLFASQRARSSNGLRITDGAESLRDDPSYREPLAPASGRKSLRLPLQLPQSLGAFKTRVPMAAFSESTATRRSS